MLPMASTWDNTFIRRFQLWFSARHGLRFGLRLGSFTGLYCLGVSSAAMYTNQIGLKEYLASGVVTGALWQARVGLNGFIVGGLLGEGIIICICNSSCLTQRWNLPMNNSRNQPDRPFRWISQPVRRIGKCRIIETQRG